ncbi:MAG: hypothetical protein Q8O22_05460 [Candidatus Omnitrophota bacterium]|nr:hypothetical protein [Candidatus Omnitrophota bacterium]
MRERAQSYIEFGIFICVIVAALVAMQVYIKRSYQGRLRGYADELSGGAGYSPGATIVNNAAERTITDHTDSYSEGGDITEMKKSVTDSETTIVQNTRRNEEVLPFSAEPQR